MLSYVNLNVSFFSQTVNCSQLQTGQLLSVMQEFERQHYILLKWAVEKKWHLPDWLTS